MEKLIKKINLAVNELDNEFASNFISEAVEKNPNLVNIQNYLNFILLGDSHVGKTCFLSKYIINKYEEFILATFGVEKEIKYIKVRNQKYKLTIWNPASAERLRYLPIRYYRNSDSFLLLFDVTDEYSFNNLSSWIKDIKENTNKDIPLYLIGNKIDKPDRVISKEKAKKMAKSLNADYFEVSCKLNINISEVMAKIIFECLVRKNLIHSSQKLKQKLFKFINY